VVGCFPWCVAFRLRTKIRPNVECVCSVGGDCSSSNVEIFVRAIRPAHRLAFPLLQTTVGFSPVPRLASVNAHRANGNLDAVPTVPDSPMVATAACVISSPCAARCAFGDCGAQVDPNQKQTRLLVREIASILNDPNNRYPRMRVPTFNGSVHTGDVFTD